MTNDAKESRSCTILGLGISGFFGYLGIWVFSSFGGQAVIEWHVLQTRFMQNRSYLSAILY